MRWMKEEKGISLLEVIITAVMIGLLASLATLSVNYYLTDGKDKVVNADLATLKTAVRLYLIDKHNVVPSSISATDLVPAYLPEMPYDPYATASETNYIVTVKPDPVSGISKIYIGSLNGTGYYLPK